MISIFGLILAPVLASAAAALLNEFPNDLASLFPGNKAARTALRNDYLKITNENWPRCGPSKRKHTSR